VLNNFRQMNKDKRSRSEYLTQLTSDLSTYYGYLPELITYFLTLFNPSECIEFLESNEQSRPLTIRANTLKTRRRDLTQILINRGVNLDPVGEWSKVGMKIYDSQVPIGATPEYLAGHYMLQSASSFLPVMALAPQLNDKILDMCASPGGKSTYIAALQRNTGVLVANDVNPNRLPSLVYNIHRMGVTNSLVVNYDARKLSKHFQGFHRILLDAPCSGMGVISRDPSIKLQKSVEDILNCSHLQKELILSAIDMLNVSTDNDNNKSTNDSNTNNSNNKYTGGYLVYSTCSIAIEENEDVIQYALNKRYVKIVDTNLVFGKDGFTRIRDRRYHPSMKLTKRYYPHVHNMDGFYVAKLKKYKDGPRVLEDADQKQANKGKQLTENGVRESDDDNELMEENGDASQNDQGDDVDSSRVSEEEKNVSTDDEEDVPQAAPIARKQYQQAESSKQGAMKTRTTNASQSSTRKSNIVTYNKYARKNDKR